MRLRSTVAVASLVILFGLSAPQVLVAEDTFDTPYYYTYFDQPVWLGLRTDAVAVFNDAGMEVRGGELTAVGKLEAFEIMESDLQPVPVNGWQFATVPAPDAASVETWVATLSESEAAQFVSPVLLNEFGPVIITPKMFVQFAEDITPAQADLLLSSVNAGEVIDRSFGGVVNSYRVRATAGNGFDVLNAANILATLPEVVYAEPAFVWRGKLDLIPNDTYWNYLWGLHQTSNYDMDAPAAWDISTGSSDIKVMIMDLGIQQDHPDINQIPGMDFTGRDVPGGGPYNYCDNHGTQVAGCVSAIINNSIGVVGIAPGCKSVSAKIGEADTPCSVYFSGSSEWIANALYWARDNGYRVSSASISTGTSGAVTGAYNTTRGDGMVHFAASGNDGAGTVDYPASLASVNAIGAISSNGNRASFSNYGTGLAFVAPGNNIYTTDRTGSAGDFGGDYAFGVSGTSFSTPYAAGVAAMVLSVNPAMIPEHVEQVMQDNAMDRGSAGYDTVYGWGIVKAYGSMVDAQNFQTEVTVTVNSLPTSGAWVNTIPAADLDGLGSGFTDFTRRYDVDTGILYTAGATLNGAPFLEWRVDGVPQGSSTSVSLTVSDDVEVTSVYATSIYVDSDPTGAYIAIVPTTDALGATTSGIAPRDLAFADGTLVTLTASATHGEREFVEWQLGGVPVSAIPTYQFTVSGNAAPVAIYQLTGYPVGDLNCDGLINNGDIDPFVLAVTDESGYAAAYPECDRMLADCNGDTLVNNGDIDSFVALLSGK